MTTPHVDLRAAPSSDTAHKRELTTAPLGFSLPHSENDIIKHSSKLLDLNLDCKTLIVEAFMLANECKTVTFDQSVSTFVARRPADTNALALVNSTFHNLFESMIDRFSVYELHINGYNVEEESTKWEEIMPFKEIRSLRLTVDFYQCKACSTHVYEQLPHIAKIIELFTSLIYLEINIAVDTIHALGTRTHVLTKFSRTFVYPPTLESLHVCFALVNRVTDPLSRISIPDWFQLTSLHTATRKKSKSWRVELWNVHSQEKISRQHMLKARELASKAGFGNSEHWSF